MHILVLLFWNFLVDGHKEVLHVIGQVGVSFASIFANECLLASLGVNRLVASCALCLAIAAKIAVSFGEPTLETVETELLARCEVDEDVFAIRFASFISDVLVNANILARTGELYAIYAFTMHHVCIRPITFAFWIDFESLLAFDGNTKRIGFVTLTEYLDAYFMPTWNEFEVAPLLIAVYV